MPDDVMAYLKRADDAIERRDAAAVGEVMEHLLANEEAWSVLHTTVHGLARGVTVHVLTEGEALSPAAAARVLGVSRTIVRKLMDSGELPYRTKIGSDHRIIEPDDVVALRRRHETTRTLARTARLATAAASARGLQRDALAAAIRGRDTDKDALDRVDRLLAQAAASPGEDTTADFLRDTAAQ